MLAVSYVLFREAIQKNNLHSERTCPLRPLAPPPTYTKYKHIRKSVSFFTLCIEVYVFEARKT